ncbi:acyl carrier protein [Gilliamella sp. Pra-s65]|uniref:acyl carrier protein n=1 Tax=unclassified Gilliamella TaxID=2685620 RepID=UPI001365544E|nr:MULTISPECIES: phosphopantetheine-binding protein [unclassified Gilliamella]MWN89533.1 acyl carrier protein [Gilliamella sp. Pra-s65]MWP72541.1 acyl carrier protein [Gilliamella sp. Pra-s52]
MKRRVNNEDLNKGLTFEQLGGDSIVSLDIHFDLEQKFNVEIPDGIINAQLNLRDVVNYIENINQ